MIFLTYFSNSKVNSNTLIFSCNAMIELQHLRECTNIVQSTFALFSTPQRPGIVQMIMLVPTNSSIIALYMNCDRGRKYEILVEKIMIVLKTY